MNWPHLHLMLNHIPVLGTAFGMALLAWGLWRHDRSVQRVALATFFLVALVAIPVYLTGEPAEDAVEHLTGTAEQTIEVHEDAALVSLIGVELLGIIALGGILLRAARASRVLTGAALIVSIVTAGLMARTANFGGKIRHAELRGAAVPQPGGEDAGEGR